MLLLGFILIWNALGLPTSDELIRMIEVLFRTHGYWIVFVAALLEGLLLVGLHFPGSIVLVLACIVSRQGFLDPVGIWLVVIPAFFIAIVINYSLGRFGWHRLFIRFGLKPALNRMQKRIEKRGLSIIFYTYLHPNLSAITATSCGILQLSFQRFALYSIVAIILWNSLWVTLFYFLGNSLIEYLSMWTLLIGLTILSVGRFLAVVIKRRLGVK